MPWSGPRSGAIQKDATAEPATPIAPDATATPVLLDHERLDVFQVALEFAAMVPALTKTARPALRDQLERAASSIARTLAEGCARRTRRDRHHFFSMAQGCWTSPLRGLVHLTGPSDLASAMEWAVAQGQASRPPSTSSA